MFGKTIKAHYISGFFAVVHQGPEPNLTTAGKADEMVRKVVVKVLKDLVI